MTVDEKNLKYYLLKILQPDNQTINGTGFICHPEGYILTCYHVIKPYLETERTKVTVIYQDKSYQAQIYKKYSIEEADIAVLKLVELPSSLPYLPIDVYDRWQIDEHICSFGYPQGYFQKSGIGINASVGSPTRDKEGINIIQITGLNVSENVNPGFSGAPVLHLRTNKVIGLMYAQYRSKQAFFVPLTQLLVQWPELRDFHDVFEEIRLKLAEEAKEGVRKKIRDSRFIPLRLECGRIPKKPTPEESEREKEREWTHGRKWNDFDLSKLLPFSESYILSSSVGTGKTTFLYWLVTELVEKTDTVPVFMTCAEFERINPNNWNGLKEQLVEKCYQIFSKANLEKVDFEDLFKMSFEQQKLVFLFDGLDQIGGNDYSGIAGRILKISSPNSVLISSRPSSVISLESESNILFLRLKPFSSKEQKEYFVKHYEKTRRLSSLAPDLIRIPMLAYMVKTLIREGKAEGVFNRTDLYGRFIDYIIYMHSPNIPIASDDFELTKNIKETLKRLSFEALSLEKPQIQKISIDLYSKRKFGIDVAKLTKFGLVNLVLERGDLAEPYIFFTHQSFQEYLAAVHVKEKIFKGNKLNHKLLEECLEYRYWDESIIFVSGLLEEKESKILINEIKKYDPYLAGLCLSEYRGVRSDFKKLVKKLVREIENKLVRGRENGEVRKVLVRIADIEIVNRLSELLKDKDEEVRKRAAEALGEIGSDKAVLSLIELLKDEDEFVRWTTIDALGKIGSRETVLLLIERLTDKDVMVRICAGLALGKIGSDKAILPLIELLKDENWEVRANAADALGEIGSDKAILPLIELLKDEDEEVRKRAAEALGEIGSDKVILPLIELLKNENWEVREMVAYALGEIGSDKTILPLIELLKDENEKVRYSATAALRRIGSNKAVLPLIERLKDKDRLVRIEATEALDDIGSDKAILPLIELLKDENWKVRENAVDALGEIGSEEAVLPLIERLKDKDELVRIEAVLALGRIGSDEAVLPLFERLKDEDKEFREMVAEALDDIGSDKAILPLIELLKDENWEVRKWAVLALGKIGSDEAVLPLIELLKDENWKVRENAVDALGEIGSDEAVLPLIELLKDENWEVRENVANALGEIGSDKAILPFIELLKDEDDEAVRERVAEALVAISDENVLLLTELLKDENWEVRWMAARALYDIGSDEAVLPLIELLKDEDNGVVRESAVDALVAIGSDKAILPLIELLKDENWKRYGTDGLVKIAPKLTKQGQDELVSRIYFSDKLNKEEKDKVTTYIKQATSRRFIDLMLR